MESATDNVKLDNFLPDVLRYSVLALLYVICFMYIYNNSTQFILFIVLFILNVFTIIFLSRDFFTSAYPGGFTSLFIYAILAILGLNIVTLGLVLAVFDYGKKSTTDYLVYTMTPQNAKLLEDFKGRFISMMQVIAILAFFIMYSNATGKLKIIMQNFMGTALSVVVIGMGAYECYVASNFYQNRRYKRQIYQ